jgi:urease accessory protein
MHAMTELTIIRGPIHVHGATYSQRVLLHADRATLSKRRWRGTSGNGREFGFDLDAPLTHGDVFFIDGDAIYLVEQTAEEVLEIPIAEPESAARIAWNLGNLHLAVQIVPHAVRVTENPTARKYLENDGIAFERKNRIFVPLSSGAHHHGHSHG